MTAEKRKQCCSESDAKSPKKSRSVDGGTARAHDDQVQNDASGDDDEGEGSSRGRPAVWSVSVRALQRS